ncbi:MAG: WG repeat-containing protein, partial [Clostridia bacterium]|nr:WG repeat-containing protein [Clostridia bacterium]
MSKNRFHNKNKNKNKPISQQDALQMAINAGSSAKKEDLLRPIEDLHLDENLQGYLKAGRINILADLACRNYQQMYKIQNIGRKQCNIIAGALAKYGVKFAKETQQQNDQQGQDRRQSKDANRDNSNFDKNNRNFNAANDANNKKNKNKNENANLNQYLSKLYSGMTMSEILMGKRERPAVERIERPQLTETSLVKFCRKGKWGYKDWKGNVIVSPQYEEAFGFSEERACVEMEGKLGYID